MLEQEKQINIERSGDGPAPNQFVTGDITIAAFLIARGHRSFEIEMSPRGRAKIVFPETLELLRDAWDYSNDGGGQANVRKFMAARTDLLSRIKTSA